MVKMLLFHSFKHTNAMENLVRAFLLQTLFAHLIVPKWGSVGLTPSKSLKCQFSLFGPTIIKAYMARISSMKEAYNTLGLILWLHPCLCVTLLPIFVLYDLYWWIQLYLEYLTLYIVFINWWLIILCLNYTWNLIDNDLLLSTNGTIADGRFAEILDLSWLTNL